MTDRNPRRLIVIIVITILVAAAVGARVLPRPIHINAANDHANPDHHAHRSHPAPPTCPPTGYGSPEPGLQTGPAVAGEGGQKSGPAGLPLGYTHDETGAVNAATNYLMWMNSLKITDKTTADAMATATAADESTRTALIASFDDLRTGMTDLTVDQPQPARGAYAVSKYSQNSALIYIWGPEVITNTADETQHLWAIDAIKLVWAEGDWKLDGGLAAKIGGAAVYPLDPAGNPSAEEKHSILRRTPADPGDITDSADQTWFEYANAPR